MQPSRHISLALIVGCLAVIAAAKVSAASFQVFVVVYGQVTNDLAWLEENFDGAPETKLKLARLVASREAILNPELSDEQALAKLVEWLAPEINYDPLLDEVASNARAALLSRYAALAERIDQLPPSIRTQRARARFSNLADELDALNNARHASSVAAQLAPFGRALDAVDDLARRAMVMPRPAVPVNGLRATVNGKRFSSSGTGRPSPNLFEITAPTPLYRALNCRLVDRERVITIAIPVLTGQARYEVGHGLVTLAYTPDVFAPEATPTIASTGTFWVQTSRDEVFGVFSCSGPGLEIKDGRFRIKLPKELRD